jgi:hypothetical protein
MCNSQLQLILQNKERMRLSPNREEEDPLVVAGPATQALKRAVDHETHVRASKRRRSILGEDDGSLARDAAQISTEFNMSSIFAELPTDDDAFPTISWDFNEVFVGNNYSSVVDRNSPLLQSLSKTCTTKGNESSGSLKRSKSSQTLDSLSSRGEKKSDQEASMDHPLGTEVRLSNDLAMPAIKMRTHDVPHQQEAYQQFSMESVSLKSLLKDTPMMAFSM